MKVAFYIGNHAEDSWLTRLGWWLTRKLQKGSLSIVTHCEAIHAEHDDGTVTIASASLRDGGVRSKRCALVPDHWMVVDVPQWDTAASACWFAEHEGQGYDWRGAVATCLPGRGSPDRWFCNEAVGASVGLVNPETFGPHQFAAVAVSLGQGFRYWPDP